MSTMTTVNVSQRQDGAYVYRSLSGLDGAVLAERHSRQLYRYAVLGEGGRFVRLTNSEATMRKAGDAARMVLSYGALAHWDTPATVHVTVYHNVSPDASFGLNRVLRTGDHAPVGMRATELQDGRFAWMSGPVTGDERHKLVAVYATDMPAENVANRAWDAFQNLGMGLEDLDYFTRRLRSLSVGDVLRLDYPPNPREQRVEDRRRDPEFWSVESGGFRERDPSEVRAVDNTADAVKLVRERYDFTPLEPLYLSVPLPWVHTPEGRAAAKRAMAQLGDELQANAGRLAAVLDGK